jgi:hypothetical protein
VKVKAWHIHGRAARTICRTQDLEEQQHRVKCTRENVGQRASYSALPSNQCRRSHDSAFLIRPNFRPSLAAKRRLHAQQLLSRPHISLPAVHPPCPATHLSKHTPAVCNQKSKSHFSDNTLTDNTNASSCSELPSRSALLRYALTATVRAAALSAADPALGSGLPFGLDPPLTQRLTQDNLSNPGSALLGPFQLYYPQWLFGTWRIRSTLVGFKAPQGDRFISKGCAILKSVS